MGKLKITSWNVQHLDRLVEDNLDSVKQKRRDAIAPVASKQAKQFKWKLFPLASLPSISDS